MINILKYLAIFFIFVGCNALYAADADVLLGPGDEVRILVLGQPDLTLETRITESGTITYPLIGEVQVGGIKPATAEKKIATMLEKGAFIKNPQVTVLVTQMQSQQVSVLGQVFKPGRYPIDGTRKLSDILALAGGISPDGGDIITLIRNKDGVDTKENIDLFEMMASGDVKNNVKLIGGDIVYVERAPKFYIYGEVQRPGQFKLERGMTVLQALAAGGGLTVRGTEKGIRIKRKDADGNIKVIQAKHDDLVKQDDVVYVQESLF